MAKGYPYQNPCKDCKDRKVGCHSTCESYKAWKAQGIEEPMRFYSEPKKRRRK